MATRAQSSVAPLQHTHLFQLPHERGRDALELISRPALAPAALGSGGGGQRMQLPACGRGVLQRLHLRRGHQQRGPGWSASRCNTGVMVWPLDADCGTTTHPPQPLRREVIVDPPLPPSLALLLAGALAAHRDRTVMSALGARSSPARRMRGAVTHPHLWDLRMLMLARDPPAIPWIL